MFRPFGTQPSGNQQQQQQQQQGQSGLFGNAPVTPFGAPTTTNTGFGFGSAAPAAAPTVTFSPPAFGSNQPTTTTTTTSAFGSVPTFSAFGATTSAPSQPASTSFGALPAASNVQPPATASGGFGGAFGGTGGGTSAFGSFGGTGAFGAPSATTTNAPAPSSAFGSGGFGSSFGTNPAAPATNAVSSSSAFGGFGGAAPATSAFGSTAAPAPTSTSSLFGGAAAPQTSAFGSMAASTPFGGGQSQFGSAFGNTASAFGAQNPASGFGAFSGNSATIGAAAPLSNPPYQATNDHDGTSSFTIHAISAMPAYRTRSFEEIRLADYQQGKKPSGAFGAIGGPVTGSSFGASAAPIPSFGSAFGGGNPASSVFGGNQPASQPASVPPSPFAFGGSQQQQPAPQNAFGAFGTQPQAQPPSAFGSFGPTPTTTSAFAPAPTAAAPANPFGQPAAPAAPPASSFSFGTQQPSQAFQLGQPQAQAQQQQQPSLFKPTTGFSFGGTQTAVPSLQPQALQQQPQQQQQQTASSLFGGLTTSLQAGQPAPPSTSTGGLLPGLSFGAPPAPAPTSLAAPNAPLSALLSLKPPLPPGLSVVKAATAAAAAAVTAEPPIKRGGDEAKSLSPIKFTPRCSFRLRQQPTLPVGTGLTLTPSLLGGIGGGGLVRPRGDSVRKLTLDGAATATTTVTLKPLAKTEVSGGLAASGPSLTAVAPVETEALAGKQYGDFYTIPSEQTLGRMSYQQLAAVSDFTVGQRGIGQIRWLQPVNLHEVDMEELFESIVLFEPMQVTVYPDADYRPETSAGGIAADGAVEAATDVEAKAGGEKVYKVKPPPGHGLNLPAEVRLERCWPLSRINREPITDMASERMRRHLERLRAIPDTKFVDYLPESGSWIFTVDHFSRYGLLQEDEPEEEYLPPYDTVQLDEVKNGQ